MVQASSLLRIWSGTLPTTMLWSASRPKMTRKRVLNHIRVFSFKLKYRTCTQYTERHDQILKGLLWRYWLEKQTFSRKTIQELVPEIYSVSGNATVGFDELKIKKKWLVQSHKFGHDRWFLPVNTFTRHFDWWWDRLDSTPRRQHKKGLHITEFLFISWI